jgi:hypothetical protein
MVSPYFLTVVLTAFQGPFILMIVEGVDRRVFPCQMVLDLTWEREGRYGQAGKAEPHL